MAKVLKILGPPQSLDEKQIKMFWSHVDKRGPLHPYKLYLGRCWIWIGAVNWNGYGVFCGKKDVLFRKAHRIAYELKTSKKLVPQQILRHSCDNPRCIRHTVVGTHRDNSHDSIRRGRNSPMPTFYGEDNYGAKLTAKQVQQIRLLFLSKRGRYWPNGRKAILKKFKISATQFKRIINNLSWRSLPWPNRSKF